MGIGILEVNLLDGRGLSNTDLLSKIDPYVILKFRTEERKSRVAKEEGVNPVWNETFKFRVEYPSTVDNQYKLVVKLMDKDTFSRDDYLGEATIYMQGVISEGMEKGLSELDPQKLRVVLADGTYCGEIRVSATFVKKKEDASEESFGGWGQSSRGYWN